MDRKSQWTTEMRERLVRAAAKIWRVVYGQVGHWGGAPPWPGERPMPKRQGMSSSGCCESKQPMIPRWMCRSVP
jgi:hypothetical protein